MFSPIVNQLSIVNKSYIVSQKRWTQYKKAGRQTDLQTTVKKQKASRYKSVKEKKWAKSLLTVFNKTYHALNEFDN